jgi:uncharacterized membrane protein
MSALCGLAIGLSGNKMIIGAVAGIIGALAGTFRGAKARSLLVKTFRRDLPAALLEDEIAMALRRSLSSGSRHQMPRFAQ